MRSWRTFSSVRLRPRGAPEALVISVAGDRSEPAGGRPCSPTLREPMSGSAPVFSSEGLKTIRSPVPEAAAGALACRAERVQAPGALVAGSVSARMPSGVAGSPEESIIGALYR